MRKDLGIARTLTNAKRSALLRSAPVSSRNSIANMRGLAFAAVQASRWRRAAINRSQGSARISHAGERVLAIANFHCEFLRSGTSEVQGKRVSEKLRNQHARRVRYRNRIASRTHRSTVPHPTLLWPA